MIHKNAGEFPSEKVAAGKNTYKQVLISPEDAQNFVMRKFTIDPGGFMPLHTNIVEHEQYVLSGKAEVNIGGKTHIVRKDDVVFIPAGIEHNYKTIGNEAFVFLCLVPNKEDKTTILENH